MTEPVTVLLSLWREVDRTARPAIDASPEELQASSDNYEAIAESLFSQLTDPTAYDSHQLLGAELGTGISGAGAQLGEGIAKAGFYLGAWLGISAVLAAAILRHGA